MHQLTPIGSFAQAIVWREVSGDRFTVRTSKPRVKVSWQVTGIRHDPYANSHRICVEELKSPLQRGKYIYPQGYGKPASNSVGYRPLRTVRQLMGKQP